MLGNAIVIASERGPRTTSVDRLALPVVLNRGKSVPAAGTAQ